MHRFIVIDEKGRTRGGIEVSARTRDKIREHLAQRGWALLPA